MSTLHASVSELSVTIDGRSKAVALPIDDIRKMVTKFLKKSGVSGSFNLWCPFRAGRQNDLVKVFPPKEEGGTIQIHVRLGGRNEVYGVQLRPDESIDQVELLATLERGAEKMNGVRSSVQEKKTDSDEERSVPNIPELGKTSVTEDGAVDDPFGRDISDPVEEPVSHFTPGWFRDPDLVRTLLQFIMEEYPESQRVLRDDFIGTLRECTGFSEPIDLALVVKQLKYRGFIDIIREAKEWRTKSYELHVDRMASFVRGEAVPEDGAWEEEAMALSESEVFDLAGGKVVPEIRPESSADGLRDLLKRHEEMTHMLIDAFHREIDSCSADLEMMESELAEYERIVLQAKIDIGEKKSELDRLNRQLAEHASGCDVPTD